LAVATPFLISPSSSTALESATQIPLNGPRPSTVAIDPVASRAYIGNRGVNASSGHTVSVIDLVTRTELGTIPVGERPAGIATNPASGLVYVANHADDSLTVFHGPSLRMVATIPLSGGPRSVLVDPNAGRVYVSLSRLASVAVLDAANLGSLGVIETGPEPRALALDRVRGRLYVTTAGREEGTDKLVIVDSERMTLVGTVDVGQRPIALGVLEGLGRIYVANSLDGSITVVDADRLSVAGTVPSLGGRIRSIAVNERRPRVYVAAGETGRISAIDPLVGDIVESIEIGSRADNIAVDSATARVYVVSGQDAVLRVLADPRPLPVGSNGAHITFQVSGGIAGIQDVLTIDSNGQAQLQRRGAIVGSTSLSSDRVQEFLALFSEGDFFALRPGYPAPRPIPDGLDFTVTFQDNGRTQMVVTSTGGTPPAELMDIVRRLERLRQELLMPTGPLVTAPRSPN